jgi:hypothetical protein
VVRVAVGTIDRSKLSKFGLKLLLFAGLFAACCACTADSPASVPTEAGEIISDKVDSKPTNPQLEPSLRWQEFYATQVDGVVLRDTADIHGAELATLPANALLIFEGQRDGLESTIMTRKKSYVGDWLKVRQVDSEQYSWVFAGSYRGDSLLRVCWSRERDPAMAQHAVHAVSNWSYSKIANELGLKDFESEIRQFSGYYHTNKAKENERQAKDGPFYVQGFGLVDGQQLKVDLRGKLIEGKPVDIITMRTINQNEMKTIWIKYDSSGNFEERWYELENEGVVKLKYSDKLNSLNLNTIEMD